jgi:hypothetical protein
VAEVSQREECVIEVCVDSENRVHVICSSTTGRLRTMASLTGAGKRSTLACTASRLRVHCYWSYPIQLLAWPVARSTHSCSKL